jgi:hypothetical protein
MGFWDSARTVVDRVTGNAANVSLAMAPQVVAPGQTAQVHITIKNGLSALDVRAVLFEIEAIEPDFETPGRGLGTHSPAIPA